MSKRKNPPTNPRNGWFVTTRKDQKGNDRRCAVLNRDGKEVKRRYLKAQPRQTAKGKVIDARYTNEITLPNTVENYAWLSKFPRDIDVRGVDTRPKDPK
jgi:hypothetical protein